MVTYTFDRKEHPIDIKPHGNSTKKKGPFRQTKPSTMKILKSEVENKAPIKVLRSVENLKGGIMNASSSCDLPRDRKQVYNFKQNVEVHDISDALSEVMLACKQSETSGDKFIQSIEAAPEPMVVVCTDQQLADLERFCTGEAYSVVSADPTFNLGKFYVTPITYRNILCLRPEMVKTQSF